MYRDKLSWTDVQPVDLRAADGPSPLVIIDYSERFKDTHAYFYAGYSRQEKSTRMLQLTEDVIAQNSANYTAWYWRRACLDSMSISDWKSYEVEFTSKWAEESPKNYQVWFHRRWLVEKQMRSDAMLSNEQKEALLSEELRYVESTLENDAKNYNSFSHRVFVVQLLNSKEGVWEDELSFTDKLIAKDIRNNSAWSYRRQLFDRMYRTVDIPSTVVNDEVTFAMKVVKLAPNNESVWEYMRSFKDWHTVTADAVNQVLGETSCESHRCRFALQTAAEIALLTFQTQTARELYEELAQTDVMRSTYWKYILSNLS